jgi:CRISPR-associated protein Cmr4
MFEAAALLYLTVETPLHAGIGASLGIVDLPIQRERTTQYPMVQGSGVKGSLRALAKANGLKNWELIFGPETNNADAYSGALSVGDARLLLFPVRSLTDVFVYTISGDVVARYRRDVGRVGEGSDWPELPAVDTGAALLTHGGLETHSALLVLEETSFTGAESAEMQQIAGSLGRLIFAGPENTYWRNKLSRSLVALPNDAFRDFTLYSTEVITRVKLDENTKTVDESGALWTEENLPAETVLYAPLYASKTRKEAKAGETETRLSASEVLGSVKDLVELSGSYLQLGGDETVGRGIVRLNVQMLG